MRQAKTQKRKDLFASALDPSRCRVTQCPTKTGVKDAASVFGLDASTRTFHNGGFASFRWRCVVTMIYGGVGVWRALVPVFAGFALLCQRAILEQRSAAAIAVSRRLSRRDDGVSVHAATAATVALQRAQSVTKEAPSMIASVFIR